MPLMLQAREPRFDTHLAVLVVGTDTTGNPFKQTAMVENISRHGGRLTGIRCLRAPGDLVLVQHRGRKAQFRVVWIDVVTGRAGICSLHEVTPLWGTNLPRTPNVPGQRLPTPPAPPRTEPSESAMERAVPCVPPIGTTQRRFPRYRCMGGAAAHVEGVPNKLWGRLTVISRGGCYVETTSPFAVGTKLELLMGGYGIDTRVQGEVRYSQKRMGMGVVFTAMSESNRQALQRLVATASQRENKLCS